MVKNLHYHISMPSLTSLPKENTTTSLVMGPHGSTWQMLPRLSHWPRDHW